MTKETRTEVLPDNPILPAPHEAPRVRTFSPAPAGRVVIAPGEPAELEDLHAAETPFGKVLVGFDPDSETYVAESSRFSQPQRGTSEADAVEKLVGLMKNSELKRSGARIEEGPLAEGAYGLPDEELP